MATQQDWDQMLQCGLEMKGKAQKVIDFAKMNGAGEGDEGEEDMEDIPDDDADSNDTGEEYDMNKAGTEKKADPAKDKKKALLIIALKKKMGKK